MQIGEADRSVITPNWGFGSHSILEPFHSGCGGRRDMELSDVRSGSDDSVGCGRGIIEGGEVEEMVECRAQFSPAVGSFPVVTSFESGH